MDANRVHQATIDTIFGLGISCYIYIGALSSLDDERPFLEGLEALASSTWKPYDYSYIIIHMRPSNNMGHQGTDCDRPNLVWSYSGPGCLFSDFFDQDMMIILTKSYLQ